MILWKRIQSILSWILHRNRRERELDSEMQSFIELAAADKMHHGIPADEARRQARLELGGVEQTKEQVRLRRHGGFIDILRQDLRVATRMLARNPAYTVVAVLTLMLGIGGITAMFSIVNGVLLQPLPYAHPERLVFINEVWPFSSDGKRPAPLPRGADWEYNNHVFESFAFASSRTYTTMDGGQASIVPVVLVSPDYFSVLERPPILGRPFAAEDLQGPEPSAAIISYGRWQQQFGGTPDVLGKRLTFSQLSLTIIGVAPADFRGPIGNGDIWTAVPLERVMTTAPIARLKPGISAKDAETDLNAIIKQLDTDYPATAKRRVAHIQLFNEYVVDGFSRNLLLILFGAVCLVLLIAVMNVANLSFSRAVGREQELIVRAAIGAGRGRIVRQLLTESLLLSGGGGFLGFLLTYLAIHPISAMLAAGTFPRVPDIRVDQNVLAFTIVTSLVAAVLFGIFPALNFSKPDLRRVLTESIGHTTQSKRQRYLKQGLVAAELAISMILLVGAALVGKSFFNILQIPLGINTADVVSVELSLPARYTNSLEATNFREQVLTDLQRTPQIESAAFTRMMPGIGVGYTPLTVDGIDASARVNHMLYETTPTYFQTLGMKLKSGRIFTESESSVVINETMASMYWLNRSPIGAHLKLGVPGSAAPWLTVAGVVEDQRNIVGRTATMISGPAIYKACDRCSILLVKARNGSMEIDGVIRQELAAVDKDVPIVKLRNLDDVIYTSYSVASPRLRTLMFGSFAIVATLLAIIGVYGVTAYSAAQRTREVGIRIALGARPARVIRMMTKEAMIPMLMGIIAGTGGSLALTKFLTNYLYQTSPNDPVVLAGLAITLGVVVFVANLIPIRRSALADPMSALRHG